MKKNLWRYIKWMLSESADEPPVDDNLLTEPDLSEEEQENTSEQSLAGAVAGATTPLGTDATYPNKRRNKRKSPAIAAGDSFGGARPPKKSSNF